MPFPIGVSGGDFVACIQLIRTTAKALKDGAGAGEHFSSLVNALTSLDTALTYIHGLEVTDVGQLVALKTAAVRCQATIEAFLRKVEKYQPRLKVGGSGNHVADSVRRVQWALCEKEDVAQLQAEISGHVQSLSLLLGIVQFSEQKAAQASISQRLANVDTRIAEQASGQQLMSLRLEQCVTEAQRWKQAIVIGSMAVFNGLSRIATSMNRVTEPMSLGTVATLEDPFGQSVSVPLGFISSWTTFDAFVEQHMLRTVQPPGTAYRSQYILRYASSHVEVPRSDYHTIFRSQTRVSMSLMLIYDPAVAHCCPACGAPDSKAENNTIHCACGTVYTRSQDSACSEYVVTLPAHFTRAAAPQCGCPHDSIRAVSEDEHLGPCRPPNSDHASEINEEQTTNDKPVNYSSLRRLDFSVASNITILDVFNFHHCVQWPLAQTFDGIRFFLRWFAALGAVLQWPEDIALLHQNGRDVDDMVWSSQVLPGDTIQIVFAAAVAPDAHRSSVLHERLTAFVHDRDLLARHDTLAGMRKETLLLLGPGTPRELVPFVRDTVEDIWNRNRGHMHRQPEHTTARLPQSCLMCSKAFIREIGLAKHVRRHHRFLRCPAECLKCDADSLARFATESSSISAGPKLKRDVSRAGPMA